MRGRRGLHLGVQGMDAMGMSSLQPERQGVGRSRCRSVRICANGNCGAFCVCGAFCAAAVVTVPCDWVRTVP